MTHQKKCDEGQCITATVKTADHHSKTVCITCGHVTVAASTLDAIPAIKECLPGQCVSAAVVDEHGSRTVCLICAKAV